MSRTLPVLARVVAGEEPGTERLHDPIVEDYVHRGPLARERFPVQWSDGGGLAELVRAKLRPLPGALADAMVEQHRRLGAPPAAMESLERLRRGEAVCAVAGQQPGPLGGPLYSLHKTASAVGLAAVVTERTGVPCVPLFWMHGEDSDFAEIRSVAIADAELRSVEVTLAAAAHREGELVADVAIEAVREAHAVARHDWASLPEHAAAMTVLDSAESRAGDLGEAMNAMILALFGSHGLVVVDPRLPAFRAAARPVIDRYLARAEAVSGAARAAGGLLEQRVGRRPLADTALESFVFAIDAGVRRKVSAHEALTVRGDLSPSVALRPVVQDGVLPTVVMACGAAELAYLAQLREVFQAVEVRPACPVPRLTATWLPPTAVALVEAARTTPWEVVTATDRVLRELAERLVPEDVRDQLARARGGAAQALDGLARATTQVDASLPQMVESARGKIDFQFARLHEGVSGKLRHKLERQHPEWARLRYVVLPGDRLQERRLAALQPTAHRGSGVGAELAELAAEQGRRLVDGRHEHVVLEL